MRKWKNFLGGMLVISMMGTVLFSSAVAFAEETAETEATTEAVTEASEDAADELDLGDFEWTEDMVLTFTNGEKTYYIQKGTDSLFLSNYDMNDAPVEGGWALQINLENKTNEIYNKTNELYDCVQYFFDFLVSDIEGY